MEDEFYDWIEIVINQLNFCWVTLIANLLNILLPFLITIAFYFHAKFVNRFIYRSLPGLIAIRTIHSFIANVAYSIVILFGLFITLSFLNINQALSSLLVGAGILGLVLGFAFQNLPANLVSGICIAIKRLLSQRDAIATSGYMKAIENIQFRTTIIRTFQGLHLTIPKRDIFQKTSTTSSKCEQKRIEIEFSMLPNNDINKAKVLFRQAVGGLEYIVQEKSIEVYYTGFEDNVLKVTVWFWIYNNKPPGFTVARHEAILNLVNLLEQHNFILITPVTLTVQKKEGVEKQLRNQGPLT